MNGKLSPDKIRPRTTISSANALIVTEHDVNNLSEPKLPDMFLNGIPVGAGVGKFIKEDQYI